jgi:hypothetical protein
MGRRLCCPLFGLRCSEDGLLTKNGERRTDNEQDDLGDDERQEAGGDVVEHDAGAGGEAFELADGRGLEDVEEAEEEQGEDGVGPVGRKAMRAMSWPATSSMTT